MTTRLADRLNAARHSRFVGREIERALFRSGLEASELPFSVLYLFGPGGVGKTTLLKEFAFICEQLHIPSAYVDARDVEPTPVAFIAALQEALGVDPPTSPLDALAARTGRHAIFIDTFEVLTPCDAWLREVFLV